VQGGSHRQHAFLGQGRRARIVHRGNGRIEDVQQVVATERLSRGVLLPARVAPVS
jgi:hypothetical protein